MPRRDYIGKLLLMSGGLLVWAAHFTFIYGFAALACARGFGRSEAVAGLSALQLAIGGATAVALVLAATFIVFAWSPRAWSQPEEGGAWADTAPFFRYATTAIGALSLVAIAWNALPALLAPLCR